MSDTIAMQNKIDVKIPLGIVHKTMFDLASVSDNSEYKRALSELWAIICFDDQEHFNPVEALPDHTSHSEFVDQEIDIVFISEGMMLLTCDNESSKDNPCYSKGLFDFWNGVVPPVYHCNNPNIITF